MPSLTIGSRTSRLPIIQGGMAVRISLAPLAAAVANEGGIGVIAGTGLTPDEMRAEVARARDDDRRGPRRQRHGRDPRVQGRGDRRSGRGHRPPHLRRRLLARRVRLVPGGWDRDGPRRRVRPGGAALGAPGRFRGRRRERGGGRAPGDRPGARRAAAPHPRGASTSPSSGRATSSPAPTSLTCSRMGASGVQMGTRFAAHRGVQRRGLVQAALRRGDRG